MTAETNKKPTAFLIDSSVFVFRSYYSMSPDLVDVHGQSNHAVYGFARFLCRFIKQTQPQLIATAFDEALTTSFRNEIYPPYKANRDPAPEDLKRQFKLCQQLSRLLGVSVFADDSYEADDLIGTLHQTHAEQGHAVCVVSADKDLAQLVRPGDWWWDYGKSKPLDFAALTEKFGVRPDQVCDYLALAGDAVDNIPGVKGIGAKTACILLNHFNDLESLLDRYREIEHLSFRGAKSCQKKIMNHHEDARLSKLLSKIVLDAPLENSDIMKSQVDREPLISFIEEMRFGPMMRRIIGSGRLMTSEQKKILVVDDEPDILQLLEISLSRMGFKVYKAESLGAAKYQLSKTSFHLCLSDFKLPDGNGSELVEHVNKEYPTTPIAVITAFGTINHAVETLKKGAYDFITKPISLDTLRQLVITGLQKHEQPAAETEAARIDIETAYFQRLDELIAKYANSQVPVIIYGKRGTWKEKVATLVHENSALSRQQLTFIDCSDADENLTPDSQGTLIYQNLEKLKPEQQTVVINFIKALGDQQRIIVTTSWTEEEFKHSLGIKKGLLRVICVGEIETQSLLQMKDELNDICKARLEQLAESWNKLPCKIHPTALAKLKAHDFPGNMKELDLVLSKAAVNCQNQLIREDDIQLENTGFKPQLTKEMNLEKYIEDIEIREITNALAKTNNNKTKAADLLGISFRALRYKIKKLGID